MCGGEGRGVMMEMCSFPGAGRRGGFLHLNSRNCCQVERAVLPVFFLFPLPTHPPPPGSYTYIMIIIIIVKFCKILTHVVTAE